jgi:hypothetical protein
MIVETCGGVPLGRIEQVMEVVEEACRRISEFIRFNLVGRIEGALNAPAQSVFRNLTDGTEFQMAIAPHPDSQVLGWGTSIGWGRSEDKVAMSITTKIKPDGSVRILASMGWGFEHGEGDIGTLVPADEMPTVAQILIAARCAGIITDENKKQGHS